MRDVFTLEPSTQIISDDSYLVSYPYILEYFASKVTFDAGDVVRGAHMAYGWMPTILELYPENGGVDLDQAANILQKAKNGNELSSQELKFLMALVNNSLVGASKLLHFVAPERFPIWDSKVYSFVYEKRPHHYRVNNVETYKEYKELLNCLAQNVEFPSFHSSVQKKLSYNVSPLRSLELVMFLNAPVYVG
jgi:hypothetical protein